MRLLLCLILWGACGDSPPKISPHNHDASIPVDGSGTIDALATIDCGTTIEDIGLREQIKSNGNANKSKHPLVLAHGAFGFDKLGFIGYWGGADQHLRQQGYEVYVTQVEPIASSEMLRGPALTKQIKCILQETKNSKVNIIGHSQGGIDARVVAHLIPSSVASVTTLSTPHRGTMLSDVIAGNSLNLAAPLVNAIANGYAALVGAPSGDANVVIQAQELSEANAEVLSQRFPILPHIKYYSWAGRTGRTIFSDKDDQACAGGVYPNPDKRDLVNPSLLFGYSVLRNQRGGNDGLVTIESSKWGLFMGCIAADHIDLVGTGQLWDTDWVSDFNHKEFFTSVAKDLASRGH